MPKPLIACARMYNVAPAAARAWRTLFEHLAQHSGVPLEVIAHAPPAPLERLWSRDDLGCVFMCGLPFARSLPQPLIVAAPVPSPPRYRGRPRYASDLVVRRDAPYRTLPDAYGARVGWTVPASHSGYNALRYHLSGRRRAGRAALFGASIGPLLTPAGAVRAVAAGRVDIAPVDSYAFDLLARHAPASLARVRVLASTAYAPIPPLIASPGQERAAASLRAALLAAHGVAALRPAFEALLLERFRAVRAGDYRVIAARADAACRAGYAELR